MIALIIGNKSIPLIYQRLFEQYTVFVTDFFHALIFQLMRFLNESDQLLRGFADSDSVCRFHINSFLLFLQKYKFL